MRRSIHICGFNALILVITLRNKSSHVKEAAYLAMEACAGCTLSQHFAQELRTPSLPSVHLIPTPHVRRLQPSFRRLKCLLRRWQGQTSLSVSGSWRGGNRLSAGAVESLLTPNRNGWRMLATINAGAQGSCEEQQESASPDASAGVPSSNSSGDESRTRNSVSVDGTKSNPTTSARQEQASSSSQQGTNWWKSWKSPSKKRNWLWNWNWKGGPAVQPHELGALLLQLSIAIFVMRLLRPGFPLPGTRPTAETHVTTTFVNVAFSEFLQRIQRNDIENVEVDGVHLTFVLRPQARAAALREQIAKLGLDGEDSQVPGKIQAGDGTSLATLARSTQPSRRIVYTTIRPTDMTTPYERMIENGVEFGAPDRRSARLFNSVLVGLLYMGIIAGLLGRFPMKFLQSSTGRLRSRSGQSLTGSKDQERGGPVMFADVAGVDEAKEELEEIVEFLRNPEPFIRLGARPPRGVLLVGPPGTGKTLLAKAVAGEADVPFISCSASEFVELYVGMGASRVRDLFARAKKDAPSIVFIDEIDAVAKGRDGRLRSVSNDEREQTLNQLLTELDGFDSTSTVIVLGATNRADVLDPALRRPGRFDRIVMVEPPDRQGRQEILNVHVTKNQLPLAADVDLSTVAAATSGFTGADLANLVNEAALLAGRLQKREVGKDDFSRAVERAVAGIEKKRSTLQGCEKGVVARHEAGHAVVGTAVANLLPGHARVEKLSILPRSGGTLGFTYIPPASEDRYLLFVDELRGRLVTLLGGRAAEEVVYSGRVSTGALDDIKRATDVAYKAVAEYGLNSSIGPVSLATLSGGGLDDSGSAFPWAKDQGQMVDLVQREVRILLQSALSMALLVIRTNPTVLEGLGAQLEADDKVEGEVLQQWLNLVVAPMELAAFIQGECLLPPVKTP